MKLSEYAKLNSVTYRTAWNRFKVGKIRGTYKDKYGRISIKTIDQRPEHTVAERVYVCDSCGFIKDRDVNAALNIQSVGVPTAKQTVMGCKTYSRQLEQAIPNDLLSFL